jgi:hypothetical protein
LAARHGIASREDDMTELADPGTAEAGPEAGEPEGATAPETAGPEARTEPRNDPIPQQVQRIRAQAAETSRAAKRTLDRIGWARVIVVAVVNVTIGLVVWRLAVRRERRHKQRVQLWIEDVLGKPVARRSRLGRIRRALR